MLSVSWLYEGSWKAPDGLLLVFVVGAWAPLAARRPYPLVALVGTAVVECLHIVVLPVDAHGLADAVGLGAYQPVPLATSFAAWTLAARHPGLRGWAPGVVAAAALFVTGLVAGRSGLVTTDFVMLDTVVLATVVGAAQSSRRERIHRQEQARAEHARRAVVDERMRIARELHDALAHRLTLVNAQASVAEYLVEEGQPGAGAAVKDIARHTREALDELRTTVGVLREDGGETTATVEARTPSPGMGDVERLVSEFRASGARITLHLEGEPQPLTTSGDLAGYRIVQESLTNALKHAPGSDIRVHLTWRPDELEIQVVNGLRRDGRQVQGIGSRSGLIGLRERALAAGGRFDSAARDDGGFAVRAHIPTTHPGGTDER
ncbi:sensor histidine kinase [Xylanimonas ulmi]|nr:sensor histidine kinase [Xylanibacterium ulmi]